MKDRKRLLVGNMLVSLELSGVFLFMFIHLFIIRSGEDRVGLKILIVVALGLITLLPVANLIQSTSQLLTRMTLNKQMQEIGAYSSIFYGLLLSAYWIALAPLELPWWVNLIISSVLFSIGYLAYVTRIQRSVEH